MTETTKTKEQAILAAAEQEFLAKGFDGRPHHVDRGGGRGDTRHAALLFPHEGKYLRAYPR